MQKNILYTTLARFLTTATFIFLTVPYLIFFYGWLHWWLAILMTILCLLPMLWEWRRPGATSTPEQGQEKTTIRVWQIAIVGGVALLLTLISGIGGWGWQNVDWEKHNTLLRDLIEQPWPVTYQLDTVPLPLVYYFAYYLPAALIGKAFGWVAANHTLLIESWLGFSLTLLWVIILIKRSWWKATLLIAWFAGMDVFGYLLTAPVAPMLLGEAISIYDFEWWSIAWTYLSFNRVLFWIPNQGLIGWLATALILREIFDHERKYTFWYLGLTTLWSPFITIGLLPLVLVDWISEPHTLPGWITEYGVPNLCGVLLGGLIGLMYLSKFYPLPPEVSGEITSGFIFSLAEGDVGLIVGLIVLLALFWLLECGLYGILTGKILNPDDRQSRFILWIGLIFLATLPLYQYGYYNDLLQKASIPALFALAILVGRAVLSSGRRPGAHLALTFLLAIGFMTAFINIGLQVDGIRRNGALWHLPSATEVSTLWKLAEKEQENAFEIEGQEYTSFISQYIGSSEAPFFQWFVRQ
jgi:hypothetical protein